MVRKKVDGLDGSFESQCDRIRHLVGDGCITPALGSLMLSYYTMGRNEASDECNSCEDICLKFNPDHEATMLAYRMSRPADLVVEKEQLKKEGNAANSHSILLVVIIAAIAFVGVAINHIYITTTTNFNIADKYEELKNRSTAHSRLVTSYEECLNTIFADTKDQCIINMKKIADIEGLSSQFDIVYSDIKTELWVLGKDK